MLKFAILAAFVLIGCTSKDGAAGKDNVRGVSTEIIGAMPAPHSNNAVAVVPGEGSAAFYSFNGLRAGKTFADVSNAAFVCAAPAGECREIEGAPVAEGRLASVAVLLRNEIYLFGGYTVGEDGGEVSTPEVFAYNPETEEYMRHADMLTPVDDAVAFAYADRYIYLVSGWHDDGNVALVQVFDAREDRWFRATDYPGAPVFGHAGGAVGNKFIIADGVAVVGMKDGRRQFGAVDDAWLGEIDPDDPAKIAWRKLPAHPGGALYRMAAAGELSRARIVFYGGGDNAYNYDGVGYDGVPAAPSDLLFAFDLKTEQWIALGRSGHPSMDHRGLMIWDGAYWTLGGMNNDRDVTGALVRVGVEGEPKE